MTSLVKKIDQQIVEAARLQTGNQSLSTFIIFSKNTDSLAKQLRELANQEALTHVSLCIGTPPKSYEVAEEADVTVVIYTPGVRNNAVVANFALRQGELDEEKRDAIIEALSKVLPK